MVPADVKVMKLRRDDACGCGTRLAAGATAGWSRAERRVICETCLLPPIDADVGIDPGVPGASLDREYLRRRSARRRRVTQRFPRAGSHLLRFAGEPATTRAFSIGAEGERTVARWLDDDLGVDARFLYNRRLWAGRGRGDVDLVVIVASGVWAVDAKKYVGRKVRADRRRTTFVIDGRRRASLAEGMQRQVEAISAALADAPDRTPVRGAFCFVGADLPWLGLAVQGFPAVGRRRLAKLLRKPGPLDADARERVQRHLAGRLPPA